MLTPADGRRKRPLDTVKPLAKDLGLTVDTSCDRDDVDCVVKKITSYKGPGDILLWYVSLVSALYLTVSFVMDGQGASKRRTSH